MHKKIRLHYKAKVFFLSLFFISFPKFAQQDSVHFTNSPRIPLSLMSRKIPANVNSFRTKINYPVLAGITLGYSASIYKITNYYKNTWWKTDSNYIYDKSFNVVSDNQYALNIDKFGHAFGSAVISHFLSAGFEASNFEEETAVWLGAIGGFGMQLYVEIQDGYSPKDKLTGKPKWGFSPGDAIADLLGASYFVARYYYPFLNNFQMRVSYYPSDDLLNGKKPDNNFSDDYEGQKLWLAVRMKNLLPKNISEYWPQFLMLSLGYHVSGIDKNSTVKDIEPHYYLALDFDAEVIPLYGKFWSFIKNTLNYIHFPMPGIEFSKEGIKFALIIF
ncbi:MAG: hypothetical protein CR986_05710 [Ignavibacteriae bacterium]|nr:MAG: hypothetical protein CR986_05710 [Ignavibacteriota bacterium]